MLTASTLAASLVALAPPAVALAAESEVGSSTVVPMQITGDDAERFSLVIMGDGYTADEQQKFYDEVEVHLETMWSIEPFKSYRNHFNVYAIGIVSGESGISCDRTLDAPRRNTPLGMSFWGGCRASSVERLITMNNSAAQRYAAQAPKVDQILALANSDTYGGAGGAYATASGGNPLSALISPHEIAHSLGGLQDEYDYYTRGITTGDYTGREPSSAHHTLQTAEQMAEQKTKWWRWLGEESESGGIIDVYEGGMYYSTGIYRPSQHSMMKSLGYQMDQVSREIMTEKVAGRAPLVPASTSTDAAVAPNQVLYVETSHPVYHENDVTWAVNGEAVDNPANLRTLDLGKLGVKAGDTVTATVVDNTEFIRDPAIRAKSSMTQTRTWTVGSGTANGGTVRPGITEAFPTFKPAGADDILYVNTTHRTDRAFDITWRVDGEVVATPAGKNTFDLGALNLSGAHEVSATVSDPGNSGAGRVVQEWDVDASGPTVEATVTAPISTTTGANGEPHYIVNESFGMKLVATDDREGALISEFRLNGDGWHNYYGSPTNPEDPFVFTPTGTNVDDLIYGSLGSAGMSHSPFQETEPGYGTHRVEYRATDASGNIGPVKAFTVTVLGGDDADNRQVITTEVTGGALSLAIASDEPVVLDGVALNGADQTATGALHDVAVRDSRGTAAGWDLTGEVSDFTSGSGLIVAENLGWAPRAEAVEGDLPQAPGQSSKVTPGNVAVPGSGIGVPSTLCESPAGNSAGAFVCGADLTLGVPGSTRAGTYAGVLTLTLI